MKKLILITLLSVGISVSAFSQSEPPYGMSEIEAYSVFYDNYNNGDFQMALTFGKWMLEAQPRTLPGNPRFDLSRQYDRLIKVYSGIAENQSDPSLKAAYFDTAASLFGEVYDTFTEDEIDVYRWKFEQGRFYQTNSRHVEDGIQKAYDKYMEAFELDAERLTNAGDGYYVRLLLNNFVSQRDRESALAMIEALEPIADEGVMNAIRDARDKLFDSPEERIGLVQTRLENSPNDVDLLSELASLYDSIGDRAKSIETAEKLYEIDPNFEHTRKLAEFASADAQYETAIRYLREALEKTDDNTVKRNVSLEIAENYQNINNLEQARAFARRSMQFDPSWGRPYLRLATIYANAVSQCTRDEGRTLDVRDRAVYYLVLDQLDKAKEVDPSVAATADRQYATYTPVLPSTENKFLQTDWEDGMELKIDGSLRGCYSWINETTTVR